MTARASRVQDWYDWLNAHAVAVVAVVQLFLTVPFALRLPVCCDEAYSLATSALPWGDVAHGALIHEDQPPVYFLLLKLWRTIDAAPAFARLFSVLCAVLAVLVVGRIVRRTMPRVPPVVPLALVALNQRLLREAANIRTYTWVCLLSALLLWTFAIAFVPTTADGTSDPSARPAGRGWALLAYTGLACAAVGTQYYLGFLLVAHGVILLLWRRWRAATRYAAAMLFVGIVAALPLLSYLPAQIASSVPVTGSAIAYGPAFWLLQVPLTYIVPWNTLWPPQPWIAAVALLPVLTLLYPTVWRRYVTDRTVQWLAAVVVTATICFVLLGFEINPAAGVLPRHTTLLLVPSVLLLVTALDASHRPVLTAVACALLLLDNGATALGRSGLVIAHHSNRTVAEFIMAHEHPGEPVLLFPPEAAASLHIYYHGVNPIVALPAEPSAMRYDVHGFVVPPTPTLDSVVTRAAGRGPLWLVITPVDTIFGVALHRDTLVAYVIRSFRPTIDTTVEGGVTVGRYVRRTP